MNTVPERLTPQIEQIRIDDELGIATYNLDGFAQEFGHEIKRVFPIFLVFVDGQLSAYYYAQGQVVIYPAVNPRLFTPRSFHYVGRTIVAASKKVFGHPLWIVSKDTPVLTESLLSKVFLRKLAVDTYEVRE